MKKLFGLKGNICYSKSRTELKTIQNGIVICEDGKSVGVYKELPSKYEGIEIKDYKDALIIPGLVDLHIHGPQYVFRALGLDLELLDWLDINTFPQEAKYADTEYAKEAYKLVVDDIVKGPNTRVNFFATLHAPATKVLMDLVEESGLIAYVGKVNMDRNSPDYLCEKSAKDSAKATIEWIEETAGRYEHVKPILTQRFIPSCTDELMKELEQIQKKYQLPIQSHLSENLSEIQWVKELCPNTTCYGDAYDQFHLFGDREKTVMAHCVHCPDNELELMKQNGVFVAHCPQCNTNISSGIAPIRKYLNMGLKVGLGSDVAGGYTTSILRAMADAIQASKLYWRLVDQEAKPLTVEEAFYLGTLGGGAFFGKVGSFMEGYEFDAVVIDDSSYHKLMNLTLKQRLERAIYLSDDRNIKAKFVYGNQII